MSSPDYNVKYLNESSLTGPTRTLWKDCPWLEMQGDPNIGFSFYDDFEKSLVDFTGAAKAESATGPYQVYAETGGLITSTTDEQYGVIALTADADNEIIVMQANAAGVLIASYRQWFECRIKLSTIADTKGGVFVGLAEAGLTDASTELFSQTGSLADVNYFGFHHLESDGDYFDAVYKADGQTAVSKISDAQLLVADTYVKLGWFFDPQESADKRIRYFLNGTESTTYVTSAQHAAATFPDDKVMVPTLGICLAAGASFVVEMDWWRLAKLRA